MHCNSWIVVSKQTGKPVMETYREKVAQAINRVKYRVFTAHDWLAHYNRLVAAAGGVEPSAETFVMALILG